MRLTDFDVLMIAALVLIATGTALAFGVRVLGLLLIGYGVAFIGMLSGGFVYGQWRRKGKRG